MFFLYLSKMVQPKYKVRTKPLNMNKDFYDSDEEDKFKVPVFKATPFKLTQVILILNPLTIKNYYMNFYLN